MISTFTA